jgi:hypothetical protein
MQSRKDFTQSYAKKGEIKIDKQIHMFGSPDGNGNPFVLVFSTKDWNVQRENG